MSPLFLFIIANACCFGLAVPVKAIIVDKFPVEKIFIPYIDIRSELTHTFDSYDASYFEGKDLGERPCTIGPRFVRILLYIDDVEVTNQDIHNRVEKLKVRKEKLIKNLEKVNVRAEKAGTIKLLLDIPDIYVPEINLKKSYKNILVYNKALYNDINKKTCNPECAMTHIEQNSLSIVDEIDHIKKKQGSLISTLTAFERSFDELEKLQLMKETELTQRGF